MDIQSGGKVMNVQDMIDLLNKVEDKQLPICIEDWNENYRVPAVITNIDNCIDSRYLVLGDGEKIGDYICLEAGDNV